MGEEMKTEGDRLDDIYVGVAPEDGFEIPDPTEELVEASQRPLDL